MITIHEAREIVKKNLPDPRIEKVDLAEAPGKVLAEDVFAREPSPRFTNSAMDGFAVRWEDVKGAEAFYPVTLQIVGESRAAIFAPSRRTRVSNWSSSGDGPPSRATAAC